MVLVSWFLMLTQISKTLTSSELCKEDLCANQIKHVMCISQRNDNCTAIDFPDDPVGDRLHFVMLHAFNQFRNSWARGLGLNKDNHYPGANNMHRVVWSNELESYAHKACSRCLVDSGDDCRDTIEGSVAQLFFFKLYDNNRPPGDVEVFDSWVLDAPYITNDEIKNYTELSFNLTTPSIIYWQLREMGCSAALVTLLNSSSARLVICNLYPAGPIQGLPIYRAGKPCEDCSLGYRCKEDTRYAALCHKRLLSVEDIEPYSGHALMCRVQPSAVFIIFANIVLLANIVELYNKLRFLR